MDKLGQLGIPHFDPAAPPSRIEIVQRAIQHVGELQRHIAELMAGRGETILSA